MPRCVDEGECRICESYVEEGRAIENDWLTRQRGLLDLIGKTI